jgi:hypothetical protein
MSGKYTEMFNVKADGTYSNYSPLKDEAILA